MIESYKLSYNDNVLENTYAGSLTGNLTTVHDMGCGYSGTSGTRWTKWYGYSYNVQNKNVDFDNNTHLNIWKVIGINRK